MNDLLSKISSYDVLNYLLSGIVFAVLGSEIVNRPLTQRDTLTGVFLYYFLGMVVSRFGSLIIEPILKGLAFVKLADYKDFVAASQKDGKLEVLSEVNNTYRTLAALFILLLLLKVFVKFEARFPDIKPWEGTILVSLLVILFLASYRKQTNYVRKRIKANCEG